MIDINIYNVNQFPCLHRFSFFFFFFFFIFFFYFHDKSGRAYYFHRAENRVSWTVPRPDRYQVTPDLRMKFKVGEVEDFKNLFQQYDTDGSGDGKITYY